MEDIDETLKRTNKIWMSVEDKQAVVQSFGFKDVADFINWVQSSKNENDLAFMKYYLMLRYEGVDAFDSPENVPQNRANMVVQLMKAADIYASADIILEAMILARERTILESNE